MKNINKILSLVLGIFILTSCFFKDPGTEIKFTDLLIEIEPATAQGDANTKDTRLYVKAVDGQFVRDSIKVNLVGAHQAEDVVVNFEIAPGADESGTTAVLGVHYRLVSNGQITIPAGKSYAYIHYEVNDDVISDDPSEFVAIRINLTATSKGRLSENYKTHRVVLGAVCPFNINQFVGTYETDEPGYGTYTNVSTLGANPNTIVIDNFWDVGASITYVFNPSTGQVTIPGQTFAVGTTTYNVTGNGTGSSFDTCTGEFVVPYVVRVGATIGSGSVIDNNVHTFRKQ